jgi:hypothetical protein
MAVGLLFAALLAVPNASFARYESLLDAFGSPTLGAIDPNGLSISGWQSGPSSTFDQANQYFGSHATWERVPFGATDLAAAGPSTVYLDVIRTDDSGSLAAYGVEACYNFHGYTTLLNSSQDVGAGVQAKVSSFRSPIGATDWAILWWEWPFSAGGQTRYERLVLLAPLDPSTSTSAATKDTTFAGAESTLESMARSITSAGLKDPAQTPDPGAIP